MGRLGVGVGAAALPLVFRTLHIAKAASSAPRPRIANLSPRGNVFRLKLFGSASIEGPDGPLTGRPVQRRRIGLLALLALARQRGLTRDKLIGALWPDADPERGRHLLSDSVYRVNQAVGGEALVAIGDGLRIDPARLASDAWEFADAFDRREWQHAVELYVAPFLDGFYLPGADELERWVDAQREQLARQRARALEELAQAAEGRSATEEAVQWWRLLAAQDPHSSRVAQRLMRALDGTGDAAGALQHARTHTRLLKNELGLQPDAELLAFVEELQTHGRRRDALPAKPASAQAAEPAPALPARAMPPSLAVLPFVNLSADPENEYFADGITEDLIAHLSRIGTLNVISRASMMRFRSGETNLRAIGAALGAKTLLGGSVRRVGDRVRIVAQLVDAGTGRCLWAETYDRRLTDVFAIQTDVALQIGAALHAQLSPEERTGIHREPTQNLQAYQLYLQGRHCFARFTSEGMRQGVRYFERAIEMDPAYALAYVGVAMAYQELGETGNLEPDVAYARARAAAAEALAIDEGLADAHCMLGQLAAVCDFDWANAEREFKRALELRPNGADTHDLYGRMCSALGRYDEAVAMERRAQELDPLAHRCDFATALLRAGRYEEAVRASESAVEFDPRDPRAHATLGWAYLKNGRPTEGLTELERAVALAPGSTAWRAQLGQAHALGGNIEAARAILGELESMAAERYVSPYHLAYVYAGLGENDRAMDCLERAYAERAGAVYGVKHSFLFTTLHGHPRFRALLKRMNVG
jgi:TolB-like protein/two-component SAPR family response regulator